MTSVEMLQMQELFTTELFEYFGYDIVGSDSHPLKSAFELYVKMKREEEEEKKEGGKTYIVTDITFDDEEDEDGEMTEEDWNNLKQSVYDTTWIAQDEDDLGDKITETTGWLICGFSCEENYEVDEETGEKFNMARY